MYATTSCYFVFINIDDDDDDSLVCMFCYVRRLVFDIMSRKEDECCRLLRKQLHMYEEVTAKVKLCLAK